MVDHSIADKLDTVLIQYAYKTYMCHIFLPSIIDKHRRSVP
jgi:hypothetical protein